MSDSNWPPHTTEAVFRNLSLLPLPLRHTQLSRCERHEGNVPDQSLITIRIPGDGHGSWPLSMQYHKWRRWPLPDLYPSWPLVTAVLEFDKRALNNLGPLIKGINACNTRPVGSFAPYHPLGIPMLLLKYCVDQSAKELDRLLGDVCDMKFATIDTSPTANSVPNHSRHLVRRSRSMHRHAIHSMASE